jgi:hypothetical protein
VCYRSRPPGLRGSGAPDTKHGSGVGFWWERDAGQKAAEKAVTGPCRFGWLARPVKEMARQSFQGEEDGPEETATVEAAIT